MIDRRHFVYGVTAASLLARTGLAARAKIGAVGQFTLHEPTELAWIVAGLSPLGRGKKGTIRRNTPYFAAVEQWFARYTDHPAIAALGPNFNLPRLVGNAADYQFDAEGRLLRLPGATSLWDDPEGDLFTKYRVAIEDFARRSDARRFLRIQAPVLAASYTALAAIVDIGDIKHWLETQFTERPAPIQIFVSPLTDGWNWTNLGGTTPRSWVPEPKSNSLANPVERFTVVASVFTEVDHIYVNPVTKTCAAAVETAFAKSKGWATETAWTDYESAELVFNEYMTWGVFLEYAREHISPTDYPKLADKIVHFMEAGRGFIRFGEFVVTLRQVRRSKVENLWKAFPEIILRSR